jgi:asparagine synthase (glutamine-hydrolysing)
VLIRENLRLEANARIDDRADESLSDDELILNAYEIWGEDCVNHLIGDFAFAIWDERKQQLFCARDHFGVKPFFYTHIDGNFSFSSRLNELRRNPLVSNTLNEIAVGDYLLFGINQDLSTTVFKDIQRLPPGHTLTVTNNEIKIRRYWTPSLPSGEIRFPDNESYVRGFVELLSRAVRDRLRTDRVAIAMSGGLDSTSLAAIALEHSLVAAFTVVYDTLIPDKERHYSDLAAKHLGIPITHLNADRYSLFDGDMNQAEPFLLSPLTGQFNELLRSCAASSSVALTGYDGDAFMHEPQPPRFGIRTRIRKMFRKPDSIPEWIDEAFAKRTNLHERWKQVWSNTFNESTRPAAMRALNAKIWTLLFEGYDPGATKLNLDVRHPFLDIRLIEYLLAIPTRPWCVNKHILRSAMSNKLPPAVLNRPKTGLLGDPALQLVRHASVRWLDHFEVSPQLRTFVDINRRRPVAEEETPEALWASLRVFALNYWLTNSQSSGGTAWNVNLKPLNR